MSTITQIREAIRQLPPEKAWQLAEELRDYLDILWDREFEQDVQAGRLDAVIAKARAEHASGQTRAMDEIIGDDRVLAPLSPTSATSPGSHTTNLPALERESVGAGTALQEGA